MIVEFSRSGRSNAAAGFLESLPASGSRNGLSFEAELAGLIRDSLVKAGLPPDRFQIALTPAAGPEGGARQILVSLPAAHAEELPRAAQAGALGGGEAADPVSVLKTALEKAGLDPERFSFTESREPVWWPGGTYVNHQILFEAGAAREYYDVALMLRNPEVTVIEIRRLLALSGYAEV